MTTPPNTVPLSPFLLLWLVVRISTLTELLAMARQTVGAQQAEFQAERAAWPTTTPTGGTR